MSESVKVLNSDNDEKALEGVLAEIGTTEDQPHRIVRRDFPTLLSPDPLVEPTSGAGQAPSKSYGPYIDRLWHLVVPSPLMSS
jgi:hypothetical protein